MTARLHTIVCLFFLGAVWLIVAPASAQNANNNAPLEITADQTLEWHRNDQQYIARGNVLAVQGDVRIAADTLTADYRETAASSIEIYRLTATGNVIITSRGNTAYGSHAVYDVDKGLAVMTGNNLRLVSPDQTVTARDRFEYWVQAGRLAAIGNAAVTRGEDRLTAAQVSAIFQEDGSGQRRLARLDADRNVVITTPEEILTGDNAFYLASTDTAELLGNVRITRGPNILEGERAEVNLATNVSKMYGSAAQGGRVRGVFYPDSDDNPPGNTDSGAPNGQLTGP